MKRILSSIALFLAGIGLALAAVNINTASVDELNTVKGIGPSKAKAIVEYREKNGPYKTLDDLKEVKGFGAKSVDKLRGELSVSDASAAAPKKKK
ncbi:MAG: helix-hairpin-helix domain-containing protein [Azonexus sp.]|jgi:competence protein ComEA|uniref:ComEA family DNA-binding protein n=1 Tax=Azonexus sp. TaxID=1872668 RepID=UPI00281A184B|nr:helix-hairpin-helix domain-containing protein [Azonexus sp.]MDR0777203.1 helix-hairpin-helix domain-containing protein [Azonexus sp.]